MKLTFKFKINRQRQVCNEFSTIRGRFPSKKTQKAFSPNIKRFIEWSEK